LIETTPINRFQDEPRQDERTLDVASWRKAREHEPRVVLHVRLGALPIDRSIKSLGDLSIGTDPRGLPFDF
jgi:hypothetical protein